MTKTLAIDADVTAALDRWAAAVGTPDHQAASEALDALLVDLCAARRNDPDDLLTYLMDWADGDGLIIRHVAPNPDTWWDDIEKMPVLAINHGETIWTALRRSYAENATRQRSPNDNQPEK